MITLIFCVVFFATLLIPYLVISERPRQLVRGSISVKITKGKQTLSLGKGPQGLGAPSERAANVIKTERRQLRQAMVESEQALMEHWEKLFDPTKDILKKLVLPSEFSWSVRIGDPASVTRAKELCARESTAYDCYRKIKQAYIEHNEKVCTILEWDLVESLVVAHFDALFDSLLLPFERAQLSAKNQEVINAARPTTEQEMVTAAKNYEVQQKRYLVNAQGISTSYIPF